jgi:hypothetical protein
MTKNSASHVRRRAIAVCIAISASALARFELLAQENDRVTIDARRCMELESPDERLACFEAQVDDAGDGARKQSSSPPVDDASPRSERRSTSPAEVARSQRRDNDRDAPARSERVAKIAALEQRARDRYLITLDTGDIYEQRFPERYALRVGQRVRIYRSQWGDSERLQADGVNGFIQIVRVR